METAAYQQDEAKRRRSTARGKRRMRAAIRLVDEAHEGKREEAHEKREEDQQKREEDEKTVTYRSHWENCFAGHYGCFEDTTIVPSMRYTFGSTLEYATVEEGLQIFSIKITQLKEEEGFLWPLHVYGLIATRDSIDHRRNLLFQRARDNCQTITQEDPFLLLTGPSRAVVLIDPVVFEVQLKAKGKTESEDKVLIFSVFFSQYACGYSSDPPCIVTKCLDGNRCELELHLLCFLDQLRPLSVLVVHGSWPDHLRGLVVTCTASLNKDIVLVDSRDGRMPISDSGAFELSRRVVSVELDGELEVDIVALQVDGNGNSSIFAKGQVGFMPGEASLSHDICNLGFCVVRITVGWSLLTPVDIEQRPDLEGPDHRFIQQGVCSVGDLSI